MLDFYYIDLYFNPDEYGFRTVVQACVGGLIEAGCKFQKVTMAKPDARGIISLDDHVAIGVEDLPGVAEAFVEDMASSGSQFVSFPPLGRVMFRYPFEFDEHLMEEINEEEGDTRSNAEDIGMAFMYTVPKEAGRKIKVSISFWEEYVLTHGEASTHLTNMHKVLDILRKIYAGAVPYFGAMNDEIHLDTDKSLGLLMEGKVPVGNEFVIVGRGLMSRLSPALLKGVHWTAMPDGGVIIQFEDKWGGRYAV